MCLEVSVLQPVYRVGYPEMMFRKISPTNYKTKLAQNKKGLVRILAHSAWNVDQMAVMEVLFLHFVFINKSPMNKLRLKLLSLDIFMRMGDSPLIIFS